MTGAQVYMTCWVIFSLFFLSIAGWSMRQISRQRGPRKYIGLGFVTLITTFSLGLGSRVTWCLNRGTTSFTNRSMCRVDGSGWLWEPPSATHLVSLGSSLQSMILATVIGLAMMLLIFAAFFPPHRD